MTSRAILRLKKHEERRIQAGHLWVFSNEIDVRATPLVGLEPGSEAEIHDSHGNFLGAGYVNPHSLIAFRLLTRDRKREIGEDLLRSRLSRALALRETLFAGEPFYRLAFGEGDGLPGLVVDRFGETLVVQPTTAGMERLLEAVVPVLVELTGAAGVLLRADAPARLTEGLELYVRPACGSVPEAVAIRENGVRFQVPMLEGQKTGWYYDHRLNRERMRRYVPGRRVLDVFAYLGAWGVAAATFGAREVICVDSSAPALKGIHTNADINGVADRVQVRQGDAFDVLKRLEAEGESFDVIVLDPPAFIKRKKDAKEGEQAYRRLNALGLSLLRAGGMLVSASCSFHLGRDTLLRAILWAATRQQREIQVVEEGHQAPDHPIHPAIPETAYLKAFVVRVLG
jgi:23S rRNA (cytosine1962-C5)-methyltransferase